MWKKYIVPKSSRKVGIAGIYESVNNDLKGLIYKDKARSYSVDVFSDKTNHGVVDGFRTLKDAEFFLTKGRIKR